MKELGEGTLDLEKFRYYMIQDYRYLLQYAKVFALGVVKSRDEALMRRFAKMVNDTLDGEMKIHKAYMARLGITEEEVMNTPSHFINSAYTSYMLDEAFRGGVLEVITAVLSCAWSYQYIAAHLNEIPGRQHIRPLGNGCNATPAKNIAMGLKIISSTLSMN